MKIQKISQLLLLAAILTHVGVTFGADSQPVDQKQLEWFSVSTLKGVREIYPQVALEIIEKNSTKSNYVPQIGLLTQKDLQKNLEQLLQKSGIRTTNKFSAKSADSPTSLNVTVFARVQNEGPLISYAVFVYTEAMQPEILLRDNKIRSFSRTWPMVPMGDETRALLFLTPETITKDVTREVTRQVRNFIIDYSQANPSRKITVPELEKPEENNTEETSIQEQDAT